MDVSNGPCSSAKQHQDCNMQIRYLAYAPAFTAFATITDGCLCMFRAAYVLRQQVRANRWALVEIAKPR